MKSTTDLWLASWLIEIKGMKLNSYKVKEKGRGLYFFNIDDDTWQKLKLEFLNSDISKIKQCQEKLKDLVY